MRLFDTKERRTHRSFAGDYKTAAVRLSAIEDESPRATHDLYQIESWLGNCVE